MRLDPLLKPRSIAIVGASPTGTPNEVRGNLRRIGYGGDVILVNPRRTEIDGEPCYPSVASSGRAPDVAALCVRADRVPDALREAVGAGARSAVVFADGFARAEGGVSSQAELTRIARDADIPLLGPNCMGILAPAFGTAIYIDWVSRLPRPGVIGLVTQSGSVGVAGINHTGTFGLSAMISVGNEAGVTLADAVDALATDGVTRAIAIFAEGISDGHGLVAAIRRAGTSGVRVAVCKTARTAGAILAAQSHTGAMANDQRVVRAVLEAAGAVVVDDLDELFAAAELLATGRRYGPRLSALTLSGGHVGLLRDVASVSGVEFPDLSNGTHAAIDAALGVHRTVANPLDCWVNDDVVGSVRNAARALLASRDIDGLVFAVDTPADPPTSFVEMGRDIATIAADAAARDNRPVIMQATTIANDDPEVTASLKAAGVPRLIGLRAGLAAWGAIVRAEGRRTVAVPARDGSSPEATDEAGAYAVLTRAGIETPRHTACHTADAAVAAAIELGFPVVVKVLSATIVHKTEVGGVAVGLTSSADVRARAEAMLRIPGATGVLVAETIDAGPEAFVGAKVDPSFGPVVMLGAGGVDAELLDDVAVLPAPTDTASVDRELSQLKFARRLRGWRGAAPIDPASLVQIIMRVGEIIASAPSDLSIDLNPVRLVGNRAIVLDAKFVRAAE